MAWEGLNRRKFPRVNFPCLIKIITEGKVEGSLLTHTENISIGGAAVIIKKSMELFAQVLIEIDLMDGSDPVSCYAKVVWVVRRKAIEAEKPSFYDIGFEFIDIREEQRNRVAIAVEHLVQHGRETAYK
ncbi:MAG: PilZ domain-containing protein [Candidatus Omnitrophica bacterium]|nr:PilZ domain-containing protein [Candidatus Omnitrophota bacterium]